LLKICNIKFQQNRSRGIRVFFLRREGQQLGMSKLKVALSNCFTKVSKDDETVIGSSVYGIAMYPVGDK